MARVQDLTVEIKCDTEKLKREMIKAAQKAKEVMDTYTYDAFTTGGLDALVNGRSLHLYHVPSWKIKDCERMFKLEDEKVWLNSDLQEREQMKKLYKVFVVYNGEPFEVNALANSPESAKFYAVDILRKEEKLTVVVDYDDLDVYALEIFTLKKRGCC